MMRESCIYIIFTIADYINAAVPIEIFHGRDFNTTLISFHTTHEILCDLVSTIMMIMVNTSTYIAWQDGLDFLHVCVSIIYMNARSLENEKSAEFA
jgi:hypothetical protein